MNSCSLSAPDSPAAFDPDAELMLQARESVPDAFCTIVRRYRQSLTTFFVRQGARDDSEDLAQETFIRLHRYRDRYQPSAKFTTFLFRIARNAWIDHRRRETRYQRLTTTYERESALLRDPHGHEPEPRADIEVALASLSVKHREAVELYYFQGLRLHEIAARSSVPVGTVKSRVNHALHKLRKSVCNADALSCAMTAFCWL